MTHEFSPAGSDKEPSLPALELAGSLQGVMADVAANRWYDLDIHQEGALQAIGEGLVSGVTEGYVESATGSGKTLLLSLLTEAAVRAGKRVHILAPTTQIGDQLIGSDGETGLGKFTSLLDDMAVRQNYGRRRANPHAQVVVSTYAGVLEEFKARERGGGRLGEFDLILGDESHRSLGAGTSQALNQYMPDAVKVGFSATPDFGMDRRSEEVWGKSWFEFSFAKAIETDKASPVRALIMQTDTSLELSDYRKEFTDKELAPLINSLERNGMALQLTQDFLEDGRQGIVACIPGQENAHARAMARYISELDANGRKVVAKSIGSHLDPKVQKQYLDDYRAGKIDVLTFTRAIEEGWDSDKASFCINLAPTTSPVRLKQLLGRIIRPKKDGKEAIFVDFVDDKVGVAKKQYTVLHALGIEEFDANRVLGSSQSQNRGGGTPRSLLRVLRPDLYERLMRVQGKPLQDIVMGKTGVRVSPIEAHWEQVLAKEGMPAELPYNVTFDSVLVKKYERAAEILRSDLGVEPTSDEIADYLSERGAKKEHERVIREFGRRVILDDDALGNLMAPAVESVEDIVGRLALKGALETVLDTLSEREAGVVRMRNGLVDDTVQRSFDQIGMVYGVTRERVRQIDSKAMSKLRHPQRARLIRDFLDG